MPAMNGMDATTGRRLSGIDHLRQSIRDILTKSLGSSNPNNMVRATVKGLEQLKRAEAVAELRGKTVQELLG